MKTIIVTSVAALLAIAGSASAQTVVRAPFVRVETGGPGTYVRAPFVNLFVPAGPGPVYFGPPPAFPPPAFYPPQGPQGFFPPAPMPVDPKAPPAVAQAPFPVAPDAGQLPQPRTIPQPLPQGPAVPKPVHPKTAEPPVNPDFVPPVPGQAAKAPTIDEFVKSFKPKAGHYEVTLTSPVTGRPETVRFSLPRDPQRTTVSRNGVEFVFGPRQFVRIEFDQEGPIVISR